MKSSILNVSHEHFPQPCVRSCTASNQSNVKWNSFFFFVFAFKFKEIFVYALDNKASLQCKTEPLHLQIGCKNQLIRRNHRTIKFIAHAKWLHKMFSSYSDGLFGWESTFSATDYIFMFCIVLYCVCVLNESLRIQISGFHLVNNIRNFSA